MVQDLVAGPPAADAAGNAGGVGPRDQAGDNLDGGDPKTVQRCTTIDLMGYAMLFFPEQHPDLPRILTEKCAQGLRVRLALADPDCAEVTVRDKLEDLGGTLPGRIRSTIGHFEPLLSNVGVELRYHQVPLYNAVYRFDDQILVTPYLHKLHGFQHPMLHLKRHGPAGIFESYAHQFEAIWAAPGTRPHDIRPDREA